MKFVWGALVGCLCCMGSERAWSTVIVSKSLDQMIHDASRVVRGRVVQKKFIWGANKRYIYTEISVQVLEQMKGETQSVITVRKLGGVMDNIAAKVPGTEDYRLNEEVVLFLEVKRLNQYYFVMGLAAGKFEVLRQSGQVWLKRNMQGLTFHKPVGQKRVGSSVYHLNYSEAPLSLQTLRQRIKQAPKQTLPNPQKTPATGLKTLPTPVLKALPVKAGKRQQMLLFLQRLKQKKPSVVRAPGVVLKHIKPIVGKQPGAILKPASSKKGAAQ